MATEDELAEVKRVLGRLMAAQDAYDLSLANRHRSLRGHRERREELYQARKAAEALLAGTRRDAALAGQ